MKKLLVYGAALLLALSCSQDKAPKMLVLYYSQTSNTKLIAEEIVSRTGADIEEIVCLEPYDGSYQETIERCIKERETGYIPPVQALAANLADYDVIFLGYPVWFGTYAPPVAALLETVDLSGKKVVPFCSFGSGGLDSSSRDLAQKQPGAEVVPGYGVRAARVDAIPAEVERFLLEGGFVEGEYEPYEAFSQSREVTEEEAAIFDEAVGTYPMIQAKAQHVCSRPVPAGMEYIFEALDSRRPDDPRTIKVHVLALEDQAPVFTQVIR